MKDDFPDALPLPQPCDVAIHARAKGRTSPPRLAPAGFSDLELAGELYDATAMLSLGDDDGISRAVADDLRRRRLVAARELVRRWGVGL